MKQSSECEFSNRKYFGFLIYPLKMNRISRAILFFQNNMRSSKCVQTCTYLLFLILYIQQQKQDRNENIQGSSIFTKFYSKKVDVFYNYIGISRILNNQFKMSKKAKSSELSTHRYNLNVPVTLELYHEYYIKFWQKTQNQQKYISSIHSNHYNDKPKPNNKNLEIQTQQDNNQTFNQIKNLVHQLMIGQKNNQQEVAPTKLSVTTKQQTEDSKLSFSLSPSKDVVKTTNTQDFKSQKHQSNKPPSTQSNLNIEFPLRHSLDCFQTVKTKNFQENSPSKFVSYICETRTQPFPKNEQLSKQVRQKQLSQTSQSEINELKKRCEASQKKNELLQKNNQKLQSEIAQMKQQMKLLMDTILQQKK